MYSDDDFEEVYNDGGREHLLDNDSMSAEEDAFMQGYDEIPETNVDEDGEDSLYDQAFKKKTRRSKRKESTFDEEELEADVLLH